MAWQPPETSHQEGDRVRTSDWQPVIGLLVLAVAAVVLLHGLSVALRSVREPLDTGPFSGGLEPREHPLSRFHVRWYPVTMIFLAFDMEMLFMYPWTKVVSAVGTSAVVEMFLFLGVLLAGVGYAWREGAFRWS
jgi:NADH-quinone oxidoreductase subunit A